jgi:Tol biopolymer transport system component
VSVLVPHEAVQDVAWSPTGDTIVVAIEGPESSDGSPKSDLPLADLYAYDVGTGDLHRLTETPESERSPAWSSTGDRLAFISRTSSAFEIVVSDPSASLLRRVPWNGPLFEVASMVWET